MSERIAVLGAGPMGLAVAYQLARDGHQPVVFEADDRVGGMTASFDFGGMPIERYYHFHCTSDHDFLTVLDELGLGERMRWTETRMGYWFGKRLQPWGNPIALLRFRGLGMMAKIRYGLHAFLCTRRNDWRPLDHVEASSRIRRWVGAEAYETLWRRLFDYKFYDYAGNLSAARIWSRIRRIGRSRYSLMREKLGYLEGGSSTLLDALHADIQRHGGEVRLSSPVQRIVIEDGRVRGVRVGGEHLTFDKVISTVPLPFVPRPRRTCRSPSREVPRLEQHCGGLRDRQAAQAGLGQLLGQHQRPGHGHPRHRRVHQPAPDGCPYRLRAVLHARRARASWRQRRRVRRQGPPIPVHDQSAVGRG